MDNELYRAPGDRCLLSVRGGAPLKKTEDFDKAIDYFVKLLGTRADDIEAKWLLNRQLHGDRRVPGSSCRRRYAMPVSRLRVAGRRRAVRRRGRQGGRGLVLVGRRRHRGRLRQRRAARDPHLQLRQLRPDAAVPARRRTGPSSIRPRMPDCRSSLAGSTCCRPTTTTTAARTCSSCAAGGSWRSGSRCCATTATARSPTSRSRAAWRDRPPARRPPRGPTSTTTAGSICSSATRTRRRSSFATAATAPSKTSPPSAGVARTSFTKAVHAGDFDNDGYQDLYVSNLRGAQLPLSQQPRPDLHRGRGRGRRARRRPRLSGLVLRLRQRRLGRSVRQQLLPVDRGERRAPTCVCRSTPRRMKLYRNLGQRPLRRRDRADEHGEGVHADGLELRRHRQRRLPRHLSRHRQPVVRGAEAAACCCATRTGRRSWTSPPRRGPARCTRVTAWRSPISTTTATRRSSSRWAAPRPATRTRSACSRTPATATTGWA